MKSESRDKGSVTGTLLQFAKKRREVLVENAHFAAITSGVFTEEAQRHIVRAYVEHCANERRQDKCLESPTATDCVRFVGMLKWAREVFDTFALRTLEVHGAGGLNKSIRQGWRDLVRITRQIYAGQAETSPEASSGTTGMNSNWALTSAILFCSAWHAIELPKSWHRPLPDSRLARSLFTNV